MHHLEKRGITQVNFIFEIRRTGPSTAVNHRRSAPSSSVRTGRYRLHLPMDSPLRGW